MALSYASGEATLAAGRWLLAQVSTDDLVDIINNSIIALAVVLPAVAVAVAALGYVALYWDANPWWRAAVVCAVVALGFLGLGALGPQALRDLGIAAVLDAVNTPALAAVTSLSLATTFLASGVVLAVLAVAFTLTAFVTDVR